MLVDLIIFIFAAFIGMMCGVQGCIIGGTYDDGLDGRFVDYLNKHTLLFYIANNVKYVTIMFGTPIILFVFGLVYVMFQIFCSPEFSSLLCEYDYVVKSFFLIYFITMLVFYFVGYFAADIVSKRNLDKYNYENS